MRHLIASLTFVSFAVCSAAAWSSSFGGRAQGIPAPPDVAQPPADAVKTASGLVSKVLKPGSGQRHPGPTSRVTVHYTGWTTDGKMFDSSVQRGEPATFPLDRVIPGWTEGVQLMVEGEKRRFWIPESLAYKGRPGAPQGTLVFDVELLHIND
jgi:peptidylprolyl isomerase